ncbi:MAG: two component transcriptional regulator, AraC family [Paenibacillaceae bacterium]|jgi:YesN/AraC family two-component response regulator|nr:two component transcriptional regulator, AraC family [Paenibacillaceae bacterium]
MYSVVLVDDEPWILKGIAQTFAWSEWGFQVIGAYSRSAMALDEILATRPDAVFTDIQMPGVSGIQLMEVLRQNGLDTEIVIISGFGQFEYAQQAIRAGAFDYCLKPLSEETSQSLLPRLKKRLDEKHAAMKGNPPEAVISEQEDDSDSTGFGRMLLYLNEHYQEQIQLKDLSQKFFFNKNYASALFKKHTGMTYSEYVNSIRINKAKELLVKTSLPVAEVAEKVGYTDYFYFNRIFKKITGVTPAGLRKGE